MSHARWILAAALLISPSQISFAQTSDWAVVNQLMPGQKVKVETADGKSQAGKVRSVSDNAIGIGKNPLIQKQEVRHVLLWSPGHHGRNMLIGLAAGAGLGIVLGAAACGGKGSIVDRGDCMAVGAPLLGGVGTAVGALLPSRGRWHEVYRSE